MKSNFLRKIYSKTKYENKKLIDLNLQKKWQTHFPYQ